MKRIILLFLIIICISSLGCSSSSKSSHSAPGEYISFAGTLSAPDLINSSLLTNLQSTDSQVRNAFKELTLFINGTQISSYIIDPLPSKTDWDFSIPNVPKAADEKYTIQVIVGRLSLFSKITEAEKDAFLINLQTTAATLLSNSTSLEVKDILEKYPAFVYNIQKSIAQTAQKDKAELVKTITDDEAVAIEVLAAKTLIEEVKELDTTAKIVYLKKENDLLGEGKTDLIIEQTEDGLRVKFRTPLSTSYSTKTDVTSIEDYSDEELLNDFETENTQNTGSFNDTSNNNLILGIHIKKSAAADKYIKLFIRRIDITDQQEFRGVLAEYDFVETKSTALSTGTIILTRSDLPTSEDTVSSTNFISHDSDTNGMLKYISSSSGLGSANSRIVQFHPGVTDMQALPGAIPFGDGGQYHHNTQNALKAWKEDSQLKAGQIFSAFFGTTRHYALFKIIDANDDTITLDYIVNSAENEHIFK